MLLIWQAVRLPYNARHSARIILVDICRFRFRLSAMPMSKDTSKALFIIVTALAVLGVLLVFANHIRPH